MSGSKSFDPAAADGPRPTADQPLALTVHALPDPERLGRQRRLGRLQMLLVVLVCASPVLASYFLFYVSPPRGGAASAYGTLIDPPRLMPDAVGVDLDGRAEPLRKLAGQWLLVVVDSGRCGEGCESRLYLQRQLREMIGRDRDRVDKLWLVLDDAPVSPALRTALAASPAMHVRRVPRAAVAAWLAPAAGAALEQHLYLVDPMGQWMLRAPAQPDPSKLRRDLDRLLRAAASWDFPGRQGLVDLQRAAPGIPVPAASH